MSYLGQDDDDWRIFVDLDPEFGVEEIRRPRHLHARPLLSDGPLPPEQSRPVEMLVVAEQISI